MTWNLGGPEEEDYLSIKQNLVWLTEVLDPGLRVRKQGLPS